ncbi:MFS family permease [Lipingzhangella halophila]|uniref:MFS family permease n=1 Tax=Lipingzhangella halophila TaxID=1783352 RepID=A0A7W7W355_9ACTN|nr:MFS transporter [Lipingzhangella halophila]MBB4932128.1 MFS family permease [Lipingzhangella halophila]
MTVGRQIPEVPDASARRGRLAVVGLFLVNGFCYTNVVPWLPTIKSDLELSNTALGTAVAAMPLGALVTGLLAGPLIARLGSGRAAVASGFLLALTLPLVALAPGWWSFASALFLLGCADAWMDAAMNAHGLRVQHRYGRTIINTFHAVWSIAAVGGGLLGASMAGLGVPLLAHLSGVALLCVVLTLGVARGLLPGPEHAERGDGAPRPGGGRLVRPPVRAVFLLLGLSVLLMMAGGIEDSAASWGAVYTRHELGASAFVAGLPFVACQAMMTVGRLTGDRLTDRFGAVTVARSGALLTAAGLGAALLVPGTGTAIAGFGLLGLGVATLFPLTLAAAGNVPGVRSGDGVAVAGWLGRLGFLGFPPLVGMIADGTSLGVGLWVVPAGGVLAAALAVTLRRRE